MSITLAERRNRGPGDGHGPDSFTITALSDEFAITPRAIRFYEDKGLLSPGRNGLNRVYTRRDRARLKLILVKGLLYQARQRLIIRLDKFLRRKTGQAGFLQGTIQQVECFGLAE